MGLLCVGVAVMGRGCSLGVAALWAWLLCGCVAALCGRDRSVGCGYDVGAWL